MRTGRIVGVVAASALLGMMTNASVLAEPGGNNSSAKQCRDWKVLYQQDGSTFVDRGDCSSYAANGGIILTSPPPPPPDATPNLVQVVAPASTAGNYPATGAEFGPAPTPAGVSGQLVVVDDGVGVRTDACSPLVGFQAGAIAIVDRGSCEFADQVANAQSEGAVAVVFVNNVDGDPITLSGSAPGVSIPSVMLSQTDGFTIRAGLPSTGVVKAAP